MRNACRRWCDAVIDWLLPTDCLGCDQTVPSSRGFCESCGARIECGPSRAQSGTLVLAPYRYTGPVTVAIRRLKYESRAESAGRLIRTAFPREYPPEFSGAWLVPVPMQSTRLVERGYNQAALLARALGSHWQLRVAYHALQRRRDVSQQVGLSRAERQRNVLGAFVAESQILSQKRVILVDDVVTTGATSSNCRVAIEQAGATVVAVVAVAHAAS